jgi:hypothetical protein
MFPATDAQPMLAELPDGHPPIQYLISIDVSRDQGGIFFCVEVYLWSPSRASVVGITCRDNPTEIRC